MPQLHVTWLTAGIIAAVLVGVGGLVSVQVRRHRVGAAVREIGIVVGLFALWMFVGHLVGHHPAGGYARGVDLWNLERRLHLGTEAAVQRPVLHSTAAMHAVNYYYAYAHWLSVDVVLAYLWWRHRSSYVVTRSALVLFTGGCLLLHLISTAPPRLLTQTHVVDTAALLGQSVYNDSPGISDHLSAMPSIHVGWAVLFAIALWRSGSRLAGAAGTAHAVATSYVVVVTGNHFWIDGIAAAALVAVAYGAALLLHRLRPASAAAWKDALSAGQGRPAAEGRA